MAVPTQFAFARVHVEEAVRSLGYARAKYEASDLPGRVKEARLAAIDSKIDALRAVQLNDQAHPWVSDGVLR